MGLDQFERVYLEPLVWTTAPRSESKTSVRPPTSPKFDDRGAIGHILITNETHLRNLSMSIHNYCDGINRRDFIRVGALSASSFTLANYLKMADAGHIKDGHATRLIFPKKLHRSLSSSVRNRSSKAVC